MTGYQEVLTDPSYYGQMVCMHFPLNPHDRTMNMTPWFHRGGLHSGGLTPTLYAGGCAVVLRMDLLYSALGNAAIGFPSLAGLYFNLFHPLIQTYIFITLSLTFIGEAVE